MISSPYCAGLTVCFGFLFWKLLSSCTYVLHKVKLQFLSPAIMDVSFTLGEIEERDFEVAVQPGRDNISVCTCTGFCLRETGRNACLCRSAQQFCTSSGHRARGTVSLWMNTRCVAGRFFRKWRGIKVYLFLHMEKFSYSSKHALYFINYLCFLLSRRQHSIMWGSRGSQTIRGWACAVRTGNQLKLISSHRE